VWNAVFIFGLFFSKTTDSDFQKVQLLPSLQS